MSTDIPDKRWQEIRAIHREYTVFYRVVLICIGIFIGWLLFNDKEGFAENVFTELIGVVGTFFVLDWWTEKREEKARQERIKQDLIYQMKSRVNSEAVRAVEELRRYGWLRDGSLRYHWLVGANLENASLNLADLRFSTLSGANLRNAGLNAGNFRNCRWNDVDLRGTCLLKAEIADALDWRNVQLDEETILPDGNYWRPDIDMGRFIDREHPNFWRSDDETIAASWHLPPFSEMKAPK